MIDYSMMWSQIEDWDLEKLKKEKLKYSEKAKSLINKRDAYIKNVNILNTNADYFEKKIKEIEYKQLVENFTLKLEHLKLLKNLNIDTTQGYLFVDYKRPLGCSYELRGITDVLGINNDELTEEKEKELWLLVKELPIAFDFVVNQVLLSFSE